MKSIILFVRFLLEMITVLGILSGVWLSNGIWNKIFYLVVGVAIFLVWVRYGAPNSNHALTGVAKLVLEIVVYGIGIFMFYRLFGNQVGAIYTDVVVADLVLMYVFRLQGN
ncbi:YrdB family protein [Lactobacillus sp. YT155]|uniref:YrdB family protein n=1 Tax=Lactobacillus sp. YT155 TaxID=3060955 RepID=UPI00265F3636|nr:YrdB family protein [Lactobacillus sp. YT155]MDO1604515.1 YrdB family protein [Lactobacillus sp. YT155]